MTKEYININKKQGEVKGTLRSFTFKEGDVHIVYHPCLGISGYGDTFEEAAALAKISLDDFAAELLELPHHKIFTVLKELGWERDRIFKKKLHNLSEATYEDIKREFNIPDDIPIQESLVNV